MLFCVLSLDDMNINLQLVMPGEKAEIQEFQEKAVNNTLLLIDFSLPNVNVQLPTKSFLEVLYNRLVYLVMWTRLRLIYIRAKAKATSLPTCCIVSNLCIYTTATAAVAKIKEKNRFRFRSNINEPLSWNVMQIRIHRRIDGVSSSGLQWHV